MASLFKTLTSVFSRRSTRELRDVVGTVNNSLQLTEADLKELMEIEFLIKSSTGVWLDEWGSWFGVPRRLGETDTNYSNRILATVTKPSSTIPAIEDSVKTYLGRPDATVNIYEPYRNIRKHNFSNFSGPDRFQDGTYWRSGVIDISIDDVISPELIQFINSIKSAGVKIYFTRMDMLGTGPITQLCAPSDVLSYNEILREKEMRTVLQNVPLFSVSPYGTQSLSGGQVLWTNRERLIDLTTAKTIMLALSMEGERVSYLFPAHSMLNLYSGGGARSGYLKTPYDYANPLPFVSTDPILGPTDFLGEDALPILCGIDHTLELRSVPVIASEYSGRAGISRSGERNLWTDREMYTELISVLSYVEPSPVSTTLIFYSYPGHSTQNRYSNGGARSGYEQTQSDIDNPIPFVNKDILLQARDFIEAPADAPALAEKSSEKEVRVQPEIAASYSVLGTNGLRSGARNLWNESSREKDIQHTNVPSSETSATEITQSSYTYPARSIGSLRSIQGCLSGYELSPYDIQNPLPFENNSIIISPTIFLNSDGAGNISSDIEISIALTQLSLEHTLSTSLGQETMRDVAMDYHEFLNTVSLATLIDVGDLTIESADHAQDVWVGPTSVEIV